MPSTFFDDTTYPYIESKYVDKLIPEGYGRRRAVPCYPLNTNTTGDVVYKFAVSATMIHSVQIKDADDAWQSVTPTATDAANGEFTIATATARNGDAVFEVKADVTLRNYSNPGDIIKDMNDHYAELTYDSTNYDTAEWTSESAKLADVSIYFDKQKDFYEWVEILQIGSDYNFVYDVGGDGKRTLRVDDSERDPVFRIKAIDLLNDDKEVTRDFTQYASRVIVHYNKNDFDKSFSRTENSNFQDAARAKYGYIKALEQESLLITAIDAASRASILAADQSTVRPIYKARIKIEQDEIFALKLYDIGLLDFTQSADRAYWGEKMVKIIGIEIDPQLMEAEFILREALSQDIPETAPYDLDGSGNVILDVDGNPTYDTSGGGIVWVVG
jgi:hypothetical protein